MKQTAYQGVSMFKIFALFADLKTKNHMLIKK